MRIQLESPDQPDVRALIAELDRYQDSLYPPEARYALDVESLKLRNVIFAVARSDLGQAVGCAAIVVEGDGGELKRMYVEPTARGSGAANELLSFLESRAKAAGCSEVRLETGPLQPQALRFYARQGYHRRGPFGSYPEHPLSVFMAKKLHDHAPSQATEV